MRNIRLNNKKKEMIKAGKYNLFIGQKTLIMGILNLTPDSFSDGGDYNHIEKAIEHAKDMIESGADIIDIGGESTRPGSKEVSAELEINRIIPVIKTLVKEIDVPISVDTYKADVAEKALIAGADIVNDVWGMQRDKNMASVISASKSPVVLMHNQKDTEYKDDIIKEINKFFEKSIEIGLKAGIDSSKIILDPGIGFGKTYEQNIEVMSRLGQLKELGYPILLGTSRKSMIGKILDLKPKERIEGTIATTVMGIVQGVDIVRVHDIKENYRAVKVADAIVRGANG